MNNKQRSHVRTSKSVCVIEVCRDIADPPQWYQCLISIPGRPSMFNRIWESHGKPMDDQTLVDLKGWIELTLDNAIALSCGVQTVLETGA